MIILGYLFILYHLIRQKCQFFVEQDFLMNFFVENFYLNTYINQFIHLKLAIIEDEYVSFNYISQTRAIINIYPAFSLISMHYY